MKDFLNKMMDKLQMLSFTESILHHKPYEEKVLAALKEDNIPEIRTELFNDICCAEKLRQCLNKNLYLYLKKKLVIHIYLCIENKSHIKINSFFYLKFTLSWFPVVV